MIDTDNFLEHYGVKGMRWGQRKKKQTKMSTDGKETTRILEKHKTQGLRSLTNHELRVVNARQGLEKSFVTQNPGPVKMSTHGKKFALELAAAAGVGSGAAIAKKIMNDPRAMQLAEKGFKQLKSSKFLKIGVKSLPVDNQLTLF